MITLPYDTDAGVGSRARLGLIVLQADETIEYEFRSLVNLPGVSLNCTRIPSGPEVTEETLSAMTGEIAPAARLLPPDAPFDVIGYACTSAASVIGPRQVAQTVRTARPQGHPGSFETVRVTDPLTALIAACSALGVRKLGFVTPYVAGVSDILRRAIEKEGPEIAGFGSFEQSEERVVARITPESIHGAALRVGRAEPCDAVFISCTNVRTLDVLERAEADLGMPVLSSNQLLAWHMLRLAGIDDRSTGFGKMFTMSMNATGGDADVSRTSGTVDRIPGDPPFHDRAAGSARHARSHLAE